MIAIVLDTETTDLRPGQICQLAYIVAGDGPLRAESFFFRVDAMSPSAQAVHGFSMEQLIVLSQGRRFVDSFAAIDADFRKADVLIGHNLNFDTGFMRGEYLRIQKSFPMRRGLCTMRYFTQHCALTGRTGRVKMPALAELCQSFRVTPERVSALQCSLFGKAAAAHDARYDCTATYLCVLAAMEQKLLRELFAYDIA